MRRFFKLRISSRHYSSFKDCFVKSEDLLKRLTELNIIKPSPVQVAMLPALISHKDIIIKDQTGSGKSLGLVIGLLSKELPQINVGLSDFAQRRLKNKQYLSYMIVLPTRELAIQTFNLLKSLSNNESPEFAQCVFAGADIDEQQNLLKQVPKFLIGTPNRLLELYEKKAYDVNRLQTLVIDEVDRIVLPLSRYSTVKKTFNKKVHPTPGEDLIRLIVQTKSNPNQSNGIQNERERSMDIPLQVVVSSATVNNPLKRILTNSPRNWMKKPVIVDLNSSPPKKVIHIGYYFDPNFKFLPVSKTMSHGKVFKDDSIITEETLAETFSSLFRYHNVKRAMIFCSSSTSVQKLVDCLNFVGVKSDKMFNMHDYTLKIEDHKPFEKLLDGKITCIVATEFEARGLDIPDVSHVFMIGMTTPQSYQHVMGRTGRFGKKGVAITLLPSAKEAPKYLDMIAKLGIEATDPVAHI